MLSHFISHLYWSTPYPESTTMVNSSRIPLEFSSILRLRKQNVSKSFERWTDLWNTLSRGDKISATPLEGKLYNKHHIPTLTDTNKYKNMYALMQLQWNPTPLPYLSSLVCLASALLYFGWKAASITCAIGILMVCGFLVCKFLLNVFKNLWRCLIMQRSRMSGQKSFQSRKICVESKMSLYNLFFLPVCATCYGCMSFEHFFKWDLVQFNRFLDAVLLRHRLYFAYRWLYACVNELVGFTSTLWGSESPCLGSKTAIFKYP